MTFGGRRKHNQLSERNVAGISERWMRLVGRQENENNLSIHPQRKRERKKRERKERKKEKERESELGSDEQQVREIRHYHS